MFTVVNVVSKVDLLDKGYNLSLHDVVASLPGMTKYQPKRFAAVIIHIKGTTCLAFQSGKIVVVGAKTYYGALYACQVYRLWLETVLAPYSTGIHSLEGRLHFKNWRIHNMVAQTTLKRRPDLKKVMDMLTGVSNWNPELFPGLKLLMWLLPKYNCKCKPKKNRSCKCNSRAVVFDTGKVNMMGCYTLQDLNLSYQRLTALFDECDFDEEKPLVPRSERFKARKQKVLEQTEKKRVKTKVDLDIPALTKKYYKKKPKLSHATSLLELDPFILACVTGQFENVQIMLPYSLEKIKPALMHMRELDREDRNEEIMALLTENNISE
jgi:TATA-box binding protein (TBP) (component of TFIID and TFIIIB)